jgi:leader peptidase (prepilin peptidase)/N-methyltransferase
LLKSTCLIGLILVLALVWYKLRPSSSSLTIATYVLVFTYISWHDVIHKEISNKLIIPCIGLSYIGGAILLQNGLLSSLIGASVGFTLFFLIWIAPKSQFGAGDVKLSVAIGSICGVPNVLLAFFISFGLLTPAVIGIFIIRCINSDRTLPKESRFGATFGFAPFLSAGGLIVLIWGDNVVNWYVGMLN